MGRLDDLLERRRYACRLTADRALETLDEAEGLLLDRGMLTRATDCALPSLFEACHEEPYAVDKPGFGQWPATKFGWYGELGSRGHPILAVHRGKNLMVTAEVAALLDPVCRAEIDRMRALDPDWRRLLDHLAEAGPSELGDLQMELALKPKELKRLRSPLERCGAVVSRPLVYDEPHVHTSELARWDQVHPTAEHGVDPAVALESLVVAGVHAAVVAPERELGRWFSWQWHWRDDLVDRLLADGRLERPEPGWVTCADASA
ncbi:MAG TPA: hypothetical protein VFJ19_00095 [Nocardioidaceae bacterium]|nr:hypothetical protein [Nocardioidaceae bacterium]